MKTYSEMIKADSVSAMNARIEAHRFAKEHVEIRINNAPVETLDNEYPDNTLLDLYREGGWYEASESFVRNGSHWVATREFFAPYFDGRYDHEVIYTGAKA